MFLCKIYDEKVTHLGNELAFQWLEGKDDHISFQKRLTDLYRKGMKEFLEKNVIDISDDDFEKKYGKDLSEETKEAILNDLVEIRLKKNNEFAIKEVFDDESFEENAKVVKEVVELLQGYKIRYTKKQQYLSDFFELLLTTGLKQESGQFFTPVPIAQFIIKSIPIDKLIKEKLSAGETNNLLPTVIDYAAGSGHFITESMHEIQRIIDQISPDEFVESTARKIKVWKEDHFDWAFQYVYGIEKDYRLVKVGKVGCYLHGDGLAQIVHSDGLGSFTKTSEFKGLLKKADKDFPKENKQFDICVSNPPYSVSAFKNNARKFYTEDDFEIYDKLTDQSSEIECLFVERTKQLLTDGGIAGIILPSTILSNSGIYTKAREIILQYFDIVAIAELGSNTFMATGTNTVTLFLRRRNNYEASNIRKSVEKAIGNTKDITINGIEKPISKYVAHVWQGVSFEDYISLIEKQPNDAIKTHELYQEYQRKINAKDESEKWKKIIEIEIEKLFYFILVYKQKIVLVKSGEKQEEKSFLGYEFSNRRGSEGIHPIQRGKSIDECTQLFDPKVFDNSEKASTYIYQAFNDDFESPIHEKLTKHIFRQNLVDMFMFDRVDFEKNLSLVIKKKIKIETKWEVVRISDVCEIISGGTPSTKVSEYWNGEVPWLSIADFNNDDRFVSETEKTITEAGLKNSNTNYLNKGDLIISARGTIGALAQLAKPMTFNQSCYGLRGNERINNDYLYYVLKSSIEQFKDNSYGAIFGAITVKSFDLINIPLPPKEVQEKIVSEIEVLEERERLIKDEIQTNKNLITSYFTDLRFDEKTLGSIAAFKNGLNYSRSSSGELIKIVGVKDFQNNFTPDLNLLEEVQIDGNLSSDYQLIPKDILVVRSNGSANLVGRFLFIDKLIDKTSYSGFTIRIRPLNDSVDPKFLCYFLRTDLVRNKIMNESSGSNIKSLNQNLLSSIKVPLPPLEEQQITVSQITEIENNIAVLEKELLTIPQQKELTLKKYQ